MIGVDTPLDLATEVTDEALHRPGRRVTKGADGVPLDLRGDVELKGDARSDAVGLAKVMRETLGEEVLVPPEESRKKKAVRYDCTALRSL